MKIVFSNLSAFGHAYPLVPLALAARDAGHDVLYATDEQIHPMLHQLGFPVATVGMPIRAAFAEVFAETEAEIGKLPWQEWLEPEVRTFNEVLPRRFATDLLPVLRAERPDLVVYEVGNPGAGLAARRLGIPAVCHSFGRAGAVDRGEQWRKRCMELLRKVAGEIGAELPEEYFRGDHYLDICPPSLQEPSFAAYPARVPLRPVQFSEPGELPAIVTAERKRPLVYLTLGTVVGTVPALRAAVDGLSTLDVDVLVAAAGPKVSVDEFGELPANVHLERWVPQADVLPLVDLAVHHGGSGTSLGAAAAGVPQLFLPVAFDMFLNAGAVSAAGAGRTLLPEGVERVDDRRRSDVVAAAAVAEAAGELLHDTDVRQAAKAVAEEIAAMPSPAEVAARLPELASS
ncbi:glycosyltransferase [Amycolatopsis sp. OK19-0408]|uniref:Glycosyltransferase n=1 Tax=Amycolatopsis iheyensis TaxID=2945988 RepID=A0A9X2SPD3_9PSEU|nr:glycosyltransferase [Amycolatopsis iheyensis]MCR6488783.1 glycosyltransferase [Amycolatopsis iheyensis]